MKYAVFTASTPEWEPQVAVTKLAEQGWDGVEWRVTDQAPATPGAPLFWAGNKCTWPLTGLENSLAEIRSITEAAGLQISGMGGYAPASNFEDASRMLAATAAVGAKQVRVTMPRSNTGTYRELFATTRGQIEQLLPVASQHGVKILVELHHETIAASASAALRLIDGFDPQLIGVIHDVGNLVIEGYEDYRNAFDLLGPYLAHVHVKNARWVTERADDGLLTWKHEWSPLDTGQANIAAYVEAVVRHGYDEWIVLEDFCEDLPLEERCVANLEYVRGLVEAAQKKVAAEREAAGPTA